VYEVGIVLLFGGILTVYCVVLIFSLSKYVYVMSLLKIIVIEFNNKMLGERMCLDC